MRSRFAPPALLVAALLWVYGSTLAPGLTWSHGGADGGDLIAATATGGVPHPTGYPLYLLLAGMFQRLPIGPLAFRTNLLSACAMIGAALLVFFLVEQYFLRASRLVAASSGLAAAFSFALAPLVWSQAVITEVYALHALFVAALLFLCSGVAPNLLENKLDYVTGLACGLAIGNHLTSIFLLPLALFWKQDWATLWRRIAFIALGLSSYLILPLRAAGHAPVNWGNASTWNGFLWLVSGRLYQDDVLALTMPGFLERIQTFASLLLKQFGAAGLILALLGAVIFFARSRFHVNLIWSAAVFSIFSLLYAARDWQVYLIPTFLCFAVWIGIALGNLMQRWPRRQLWLAGLFGVWLIFSAAHTWPHVDLSRDLQAEQFGASILAQTPQEAMLFVTGDEAVFTLWYFHFALGERPDAAVVAADLLHFDWYQQTLRAAYPALVVPGPLPFVESVRQANPSRPACYVVFPQEAPIECLEASR
ncbi:MAG: hypothetical protein HFACDABA_02051 [Anaerolineales bacterium]|nr:hypothetical protein [Anaerolineales bacterium]